MLPAATAQKISNDIADALKYTSATAAQAHVSILDTVTAIGEMAIAVRPRRRSFDVMAIVARIATAITPLYFAIGTRKPQMKASAAKRPSSR